MTEVKIAVGAILSTVGGALMGQLASAPPSAQPASIMVPLVLSSGALITGVLALLKGHGNYWHFKGVAEERQRQEELREKERIKRVEALEQKIDVALEEIHESRQVLKLVARSMKLEVD